MEKRLFRKSKVLQALHRVSQKHSGEIYLVGAALRTLLYEDPWGGIWILWPTAR